MSVGHRNEKKMCVFKKSKREINFTVEKKNVNFERIRLKLSDQVSLKLKI